MNIKFISIFLFSVLVSAGSYAQINMKVTIQFVTVYHANSTGRMDLSVSVDNQGYNFPGADYGAFQTAWNTYSDVTNDPNNYDTYTVYKSNFTPIVIDFRGWSDNCDGQNGNFYKYDNACYCGAGLRCKKKDDNNYDEASQPVSFWEYKNDGQQSGLFYTNNGLHGFTIVVTWTPIPPSTVFTNLTAPEACGNSNIVLTANLPSWFTAQLPASVSPYLTYVWQEGIPSGTNYTYVTIATTTANTYTYKAPSNAPLNGSVSRQFRVYTTINNVYSQSGTQLANPINIFPPPPTGISSIINQTSCNGTSDGNLVITGVIGGVGVYSYSISDGVQVYNSSKNTFNVNLPMDAANKPASVQGLKAGTYSVTVYNYYNSTARCSYTKSIVIPQPLPLTVSSVNKSDYNGFNVSCKGFSDGSATVTASGGNIPYTYLFDNEITFTNPFSSTTGIFNNQSAGTYYTKIADAKNCPVNPVTVTISEPTILQSTVDKKDVLCKGSSDGQINMITTGGAGGYIYAINNNPFVSTVPFTGLIPGNYVVVTKDKNNCLVTSDNTLITEPALLTLSVSDKQDILCNGASTGSVTLSGSGGIMPYRYSYDGTNYQTLGALNNLSAAIYNFRVKDKNNCIAISSQQLAEPPALQNTFNIQNVTCLGREDGRIEAQVSGGIAPYTYNWLGRPETVNRIENLYDGNYILSIHDANNCSLQQTAIVNAPPSSLVIQSISTSNARCEGICDGTVTINASGGITPYTYYYNAVPSTNNVLSSACGTKYIIKVKDSYNCIVTDQINVPLTSSFGFDLPDSVTLCTGQSYAVDVTAPNTNVALTSLKGFSSTSEKVQLSVSDQYYLYLSNVQGCFKTDTMTLTTSSDLLKSRFVVPSVSYAGDTINFVDLSWPRPDSVSWVLSVPTDTIGNNEGFVRLSYKDPGTYTIRLTAYMGACKDSVTKIVTFEVPSASRLASDSLGLGFHGINSLKLYPIPNSGEFIVEINVSYTDEINASILNIFGEIIHKENLSGSRFYKTNYDFLTMSSGMYLFWVKTKDDAKVIKFLVE